MARKKIREFHAKKALSKNAKRVIGRELDLKVALVHPDTNYESLRKDNPWLNDTKLVVKPDMLVGKRGKHDLVLLNANIDGAIDFVKRKIGQQLDISGVTGTLTHFLIEPFVPHKEEYYLAITPEREGLQIHFSARGGVDVEENWETIRTLSVGAFDNIDELDLSPLLGDVDKSRRESTEEYIRAIYKLFDDMDFASIEMNPFTFDSAGNALPLDVVAEIDDTAMFRSGKKFDSLEFPQPFGITMHPEEKLVHDLDEKTGASLKLTILNPNGRIWNLVAGGGASVIFADTVADLGHGEELGNYGEYSGAPSAEETATYTKALLDVATRNPDGRNRALLIGGGIANFTDVAKTFKGIIHSLHEFEGRLKAANFHVFVRRAGPNYQTGLRLMREWGRKSGIPVEVYGPEVTMTKIVPMAAAWIQQSGAPSSTTPTAGAAKKGKEEAKPAKKTAQQIAEEEEAAAAAKSKSKYELKKSTAPAPAPATPGVFVDQTIYDDDPSLGQAAPSLSTLTWVKGEPVTYGSHIVVVYFWAKYDTLGYPSISHFTALQKKYKSIRVVAVSTDPKVEDVNSFLSDAKYAEHASKMDLTVAWDGGKKLYNAFRELVGAVINLPHAFLIGKDGNIIWREVHRPVDSKCLFMGQVARHVEGRALTMNGPKPKEEDEAADDVPDDMALF